MIDKRNDPTFKYYSSIGISDLNSGNYKKSIKSFEQALKIWPEASYTYSYIGRAYYGLDNYKKAIKYFDSALFYFSGNQQAKHWKAKALAKLNLRAESESLFKELLNELRYGPANFRSEVLRDYEFMINGKTVAAYSPSVSRQYKRTESVPAPQPQQIIIQGNNGPVNIGGILGTDDAVINRGSVTSESPLDQAWANFKQETNASSTLVNPNTSTETNYCPECGTKVSSDDKFCRNCGKKLK